MPTRQILRQQFRQKRKQLTPHEQNAAAIQLAERVCCNPIFQTSNYIAGYIARDNEINPGPLLKKAWQQNKTCYLPGLNKQQLFFLTYHAGDHLKPNRYHIPEPLFNPDKAISLEKLDLVLLPLVAFDLQGNRLGMGAGYYDRTFAFLQKHQRPAKPYLLGLAYGFQQTEEIVAEPWDIYLDAIATENNFFSTGEMSTDPKYIFK